MQNSIPKTALLVSPRDAARMLAVSTRKLWAMTFQETPGVPYVRIGRCVRYPVAELEAWLRRNIQRGTNAGTPRDQSDAGEIT